MAESVKKYGLSRILIDRQMSALARISDSSLAPRRFRKGPEGDTMDALSATWPDCPERYSLKIDAGCALSI
jgi:hypothetical protein